MIITYFNYVLLNLPKVIIIEPKTKLFVNKFYKQKKDRKFKLIS